jgi:hypothetical protein
MSKFVRDVRSLNVTPTLLHHSASAFCLQPGRVGAGRDGDSDGALPCIAGYSPTRASLLPSPPWTCEQQVASLPHTRSHPFSYALIRLLLLYILILHTYSYRTMRHPLQSVANVAGSSTIPTSIPPEEKPATGLQHLQRRQGPKHRAHPWEPPPVSHSPSWGTSARGGRCGAPPAPGC